MKKRLSFCLSSILIFALLTALLVGCDADLTVNGDQHEEALNDLSADNGTPIDVGNEVCSGESSAEEQAQLVSLSSPDLTAPQPVDDDQLQQDGQPEEASPIDGEQNEHSSPSEPVSMPREWDSNLRPSSYVTKWGESYPAEGTRYYFDRLNIVLGPELSVAFHDGEMIDLGFIYTDVKVLMDIATYYGTEDYAVIVTFYLPVCSQEYAMRILRALEASDYDILAASISKVSGPPTAYFA